MEAFHVSGFWRELLTARARSTAWHIVGQQQKITESVNKSVPIYKRWQNGISLCTKPQCLSSWHPHKHSGNTSMRWLLQGSYKEQQAGPAGSRKLESPVNEAVCLQNPSAYLGDSMHFNKKTDFISVLHSTSCQQSRGGKMKCTSAIFCIQESIQLKKIKPEKQRQPV